MIPRLSASQQGRALPFGYDPSRVHVGIVHIGLGAFARTHLAVYADEVLALGHLEWGICSVSMRSPGVRNMGQSPVRTRPCQVILPR